MRQRLLMIFRVLWRLILAWVSVLAFFILLWFWDYFGVFFILCYLLFLPINFLSYRHHRVRAQLLIRVIYYLLLSVLLLAYGVIDGIDGVNISHLMVAVVMVNLLIDVMIVTLSKR